MEVNPRFAIALVIVSAIVGAFASIISAKIATDASRETLSEDRIREDKAELRSVIDKAAVNITRAQNLAADVTSAWHAKRERERRNALKKLHRQQYVTLTSLEQVNIRVGLDTPLAKHLRTSILLIAEVGKQSSGPPTLIRTNTVVDLDRKAVREFESFLKQARRIVGSRLDTKTE